jgi:GTPase SAR1 family protein
MYYRNADAAVLVYDVTDPVCIEIILISHSQESFAALRSWHTELQKNVPNCIIVLVGNKMDLGMLGYYTLLTFQLGKYQ